MIHYKRRGRYFFQKICQWKGSVFPSALLVALPCAACTVVLKVLIAEGMIADMEEEDSVLRNSACWSGFTFLVGFLIVFRTSQAYSRFWDGCTAAHTMRAEWLESCSSLIAFCRYSSAPQDLQLSFQHLLVRLFSMLHASAMAEIEDCADENMHSIEVAWCKGDDVTIEKVAQAFRFELLDAGSVDTESLTAVMESDSKVELLLQWIQQLVVDNINTDVLSIPAPLLSRAFQELSNGNVAFKQAVKISSLPFPFPYAQTCDILLLMHWLGTPIVMAQWVTSPWWGAVFSFVQVFIYSCLNMIAMEIENPFGRDPNDIDGALMQKEMNRHLRLLMEPRTRRVPRLIKATNSRRRHSFVDIWKEVASSGTAPLDTPLGTGHISRIQPRMPSKTTEDFMQELNNQRPVMEMNSAPVEIAECRPLTPEGAVTSRDSEVVQEDAPDVDEVALREEMGKNDARGSPDTGIAVAEAASLDEAASVDGIGSWETPSSDGSCSDSMDGGLRYYAAQPPPSRGAQDSFPLTFMVAAGGSVPPPLRLPDDEAGPAGAPPEPAEPACVEAGPAPQRSSRESSSRWRSEVGGRNIRLGL